jgi:hypothetical protein
MREDLVLYLSSSPFIVTVLGVFSIGSSSLHLWRVALDLIYSTLNLNVFFDQDVSFEMFMMPCSSVATCGVFVLFFIFIFCLSWH